MMPKEMGDTYQQHDAGYACAACGAVAIAEVQGSCLCLEHAIEAASASGVGGRVQVWAAWFYAICRPDPSAVSRFAAEIWR